MRGIIIDEKTEMNTLVKILISVVTEMYDTARDLNLEDGHRRLDRAVEEFQSDFRDIFEEDV